jgi:hypothetical protein
MNRYGLEGMYGFEWTIFWMSLLDKLFDCVAKSRLFSLSCDMIVNPARTAGVKKGLNVLTENGPFELMMQPFWMFEAIPVWTTMSMLCQLLMSLATMAPLFVLMRAWRRSVGAGARFSPSVELAKSKIFLKMESNFFQPFDSLSLLSSSSAANLSLFLSSRDFANLLIPSAIESEVWLFDV